MTTVVVPYFVFETLLALFRTVVGHENFGVLYISPHWPMWYLTVLFLWRLATPLLTRLRPAVADGPRGRGLPGRRAQHRPALDLPRTFGLLPFFVAGPGDDPRPVRLAGPSPRARRRGGADGAAFVAATLTAGSFSKEWLYWRTGYPDLGCRSGSAPPCGFGLLVVAGSLALPPSP